MQTIFARGKLKMFDKKREKIRGEYAITVKTKGFYSISDSFECGQCFRAEKTVDEDGYEEYTTVVGNKIMRIGQKTPGELIIFDTSDEEFED